MSMSMKPTTFTEAEIILKGIQCILGVRPTPDNPDMDLEQWESIAYSFDGVYEFLCDLEKDTISDVTINKFYELSTDICTDLDLESYTEAKNKMEIIMDMFYSELKRAIFLNYDPPIEGWEREE